MTIFSNVLCLVVVASTQQIVCTQQSEFYAKKALSVELYLCKKSVSCIFWHASG